MVSGGIVFVLHGYVCVPASRSVCQERRPLSAGSECPIACSHLPCISLLCLLLSLPLSCSSMEEQTSLLFLEVLERLQKGCGGCAHGCMTTKAESKTSLERDRPGDCPSVSPILVGFVLRYFLYSVNNNFNCLFLPYLSLSPWIWTMST